MLRIAHIAENALGLVGWSLTRFDKDSPSATLATVETKDEAERIANRLKRAGEEVVVDHGHGVVTATRGPAWAVTEDSETTSTPLSMELLGASGRKT